MEAESGGGKGAKRGVGKDKNPGKGYKNLERVITWQGYTNQKLHLPTPPFYDKAVRGLLLPFHRRENGGKETCPPGLPKGP